jgi:signal transduction histidine kinase
MKSVCLRPCAGTWKVLPSAAEIGVELEVSPSPGRLPRDMEMTIFRIVREGLTNIHRHSGSKKARSGITVSGEEVCLQIQDNGRGMPVPRNGDYATKAARAGVGIEGIRESIKQVGGHFEIHSNGTGTSVAATFPRPAPVP